ncbi:DUF6894 family protein [Methylobacterium haplocladii]|uniref:DUF6894 domain-containing protein n=1 Tax=Methylobacterium haplocladii TaxID=1176176 RepID=A0A512ITU5_9HYPH|nr:hypothetical protein [Methylobacterium haplocladii]GEP01132.1 hypothetical protein MHA02_35190 [Methylobacterium haplocladii]GJD82908.1 hypothetical protein HPGCJGGD_0770 [Methylobacterium haplocladii]GLS60443.1 hypothetical protein GCM10007887_31220 [Methylobacterium haplocladii]
MTRYFFNVYDGVSPIDTDGTELSDGQQARREAIRMAGLILMNEGDRLQAGRGWRLEVTDDTGLVLFQLDVQFTEMPGIVTLASDRARAASPRR